MKNSLVSLWSVLAKELADLCGTDTSRDIVEVSRRCEEEGDSFLRITLPAYCKGFEQALEIGQMSSDRIRGFRFDSGGLPLFLRGFLRNVFTPNGVLLDVPCVESIYSVRQLTAVFGKIDGICTPRRNRAAIHAYIEADDACTRWDLTSPQSLIKEIAYVSGRVLGPLLAGADRDVKLGNIRPAHGPGSTSDGLFGNEKFDLEYWPDSLAQYFPWVEWGVPSYRYGDQELPGDRCGAITARVLVRRGPRSVDFTRQGKHAPSLDDSRPKEHGFRAATPTDSSTPTVPAQLLTVPKTASTPRIIVREPTALQFMQQGVCRAIVTHSESVSDLVGFTNQATNRTLARMGSIDQSLTTIDLSEASDRVTYLQAASVFSAFPNIWEALDATRSSEVNIMEEGITIPIQKFASMGSAVCFPVEAMTFLVAIFMAIDRHHRRTDARYNGLTRRFVKQFEGRVRVYGDDIVVPTEYLSDVRLVFNLMGWKINENKTFSRSKFRESCGGEYWNGEDITPVRVRTLLPTSIRQAPEVVSLVSLRNQLYMAGLWRTASFLDDRINKILRGLFPIIQEASGALGRSSASFPAHYSAKGTDELQRTLTKAYCLKAPIPSNECSGVGALLKCLITAGYRDEDHLMMSGRPVSFSLKRRWVHVSQNDSRREPSIISKWLPDVNPLDRDIQNPELWTSWWKSVAAMQQAYRHSLPL